MSHREWVRRAGENVWKWIARLAVLVVVGLLPISALAHTKLFYRMSCKSDYRKVEVMIATSEPMVTAEPTETPLVDIPLKSTLTPEPTLTLIPTEAPTEVSTPTTVVEIIESEEPSDQITTPSDIAITSKFSPTVLRQWMS